MTKARAGDLPFAAAGETLENDDDFFVPNHQPELHLDRIICAVFQLAVQRSEFKKRETPSRNDPAKLFKHINARIPNEPLVTMVSWPSWLGGSSTSSTTSNGPAPPKSHDGGYVAPDRNKREFCYESRDLFFDCLDKNKILDAVKNDAEAKEKCGGELQGFERDCARSWVKYFKEKRVMEYNRDQTIARIKADDDAAAARAKAEKQGKGWFS